MKLVDTEAMRYIEQKAIDKYKISSLILMENAGLHIFEFIHSFLGEVQGRSVTLLIGRGNNGGDGLVVARHLINAKAKAKVFLLYPYEKMSRDTQLNYLILENMGAEFCLLTETEPDYTALEHALAASDLAVDAIFGTGFRGGLDERIQKAALCVNRSSCPVVAVDIPSGVEADTGKVVNLAVQADYTIALGLAKVGLVLDPAAQYVGELKVSDISLPQPLVEAQPIRYRLITRDEVKPMLGLRKNDAHKGDFGQVFVLGGSAGMMGAVGMAALAALKSGAGLVTCGVPGSMLTVLQGNYPEVMVKGLAETEEGRIDVRALSDIREWVRKTSITVVGPGMGQYPGAKELLADLLLTGKQPLLIDADGLNALAGQAHLFKQSKRPVILTPHPGEMSRLTGVLTADIQADRLQIARHYAKEWNLTLVLKGSRTVVATPKGASWINTTGNPGMATGGSGDILAGMIGGLAAQGMSVSEAAVYGVFAHGLSGDLAAERKGQRGMTAGDILAGIPEALLAIEK